MRRLPGIRAKNTGGFFLPSDFLMQPGTGVSPKAIRGARRNVHHSSRFRQSQPGKISQFHQLGRLRIRCRQVVDGPIERQQILTGFRSGDFEIVQIYECLTASPLEAFLAAGVVDENPSHRFGRGREEVAAVIPRRDVRMADEPEVRLVDEGRGLKCVFGGFVRHPCRGKFSQFVIDKRKQYGSRPTVASRRRVEKLGYV